MQSRHNCIRSSYCFGQSVTDFDIEHREFSGELKFTQYGELKFTQYGTMSLGCDTLIPEAFGMEVYNVVFKQKIFWKLLFSLLRMVSFRHLGS